MYGPQRNINLPAFIKLGLIFQKTESLLLFSLSGHRTNTHLWIAGTVWRAGASTNLIFVCLFVTYSSEKIPSDHLKLISIGIVLKLPGEVYIWDFLKHGRFHTQGMLELKTARNSGLDPAGCDQLYHYSPVKRHLIEQHEQIPPARGLALSCPSAPAPDAVELCPGLGAWLKLSSKVSIPLSSQNVEGRNLFV